ncbi:hypothetical protein, partial [Pseudomonas syringae]
GYSWHIQAANDLNSLSMYLIQPTQKDRWCRSMLSALRMTEEGSMELRCHCRQRQHEKGAKRVKKNASIS